MAEETLARSVPQARAPRRSEGRLGQRLLSLNALSAYLFLYAPIVILVIYSFSNSSLSGTWGGFTLDWYTRLFSNERLLDALRNSLRVATASMLISTVLGTLVALGLERFRFRGRTALDAVLYLPIVIPDIIMAIMLLLFFATTLRWAGDLLGMRLQNSLVTVIISHVAFNISFVAVVVRASLRGFDWRLEEAAADLGADGWRTFWRITFPLILPGILGGALMAFTLSLDDYVITFFTKGSRDSTLTIEVFNRIRRGVSPEINALSTLMLLASVALVALSQILQRRRG